MVSFNELGLSSDLVSHLNEIGFVEPTEIQLKTIGIVSEGKDLIASAQTGSGKTAAYALPLIGKIKQSVKEKAKTRALVVVPTRELAVQVATEFERFGKPFGLKCVTLFGGVGYRKQIQALHRGVDLIVATPGRLVDCVNRNYANLNAVEHVVLDEADRLLDMGFMPQVRAVIARVPKVRQTLMFSATIDSRIKALAEEFLQNPEVVQVNNDKVEAASIDQQFHYIKEKEKQQKLVELIGDVSVASMLVFTKTKRKASQLTASLRELEIPAEEIHGDISQKQRSYTLKRFRDGEFCILIATDVAARGLDIPSISHVVNFDLPMLAEDYVHRIGRTGRAGRAGVAHSFVSADQRHLVRGINEVLKSGNNKKEVVDVRSSSKRVASEAEYQPKQDAFKKPGSQRPGERDRYSQYKREDGRKYGTANNRHAKRFVNEFDDNDSFNDEELSRDNRRGNRYGAGVSQNQHGQMGRNRNQAQSRGRTHTQSQGNAYSAEGRTYGQGKRQEESRPYSQGKRQEEGRSYSPFQDRRQNQEGRGQNKPQGRKPNQEGRSQGQTLGRKRNLDGRIQGNPEAQRRGRENDHQLSDDDGFEISYPSLNLKHKHKTRKPAGTARKLAFGNHSTASGGKKKRPDHSTSSGSGTSRAKAGKTSVYRAAGSSKSSQSAKSYGSAGRANKNASPRGARNGADRGRGKR